MATELILNQRTLYKLHQDIDFEWYYIDCMRSLEVVMIDIKSTNLGNTSFICFVNDVLGNLEDSSVCNTETTTLPGKVYLRRTRGRFFTFGLKADITGNMSFQVYVSSIEAQNGEPCFESIEIDDKQVPNTQITVSSGTTDQIPTNTNTIFTGWIHDATDLKPWILTCEHVDHFPSFYFGNNKDTLQAYKDMEFRIFPPESFWKRNQVFILPRPINGRYAKFKHSFEKPTSKSRCLNFKLFGCKLTRITDISSIESSEMLPLEYELLSGDSTVLNTNLTRCIELCSIQKSCSVASFKTLSNKTMEEDNEHHGPNGSIKLVGMCNHYMYSPFGLWKSKKIIDDGQCFAKLQNIGIMKCHSRELNAKMEIVPFGGHTIRKKIDSIQLRP
ncbi:uncharacterized protein LOC132724031 [Ruditapes philippinarum]|uniref:uncharacterized protein LOC132724031 n=1 Tax=Ruditapes philippinarum TaxID=129788 RepID=UPI00295BA0D1|nr:uncharacterized protein LOC132724031 [Ruditapes philippinarum]